MTAAPMAWVNDYVGVPYAVNGRDREGWDCWGLVLAVFADRLGVTLPDWRWQEPFALSDKLRAMRGAWRDVDKQGDALELGAPRDFAIALVAVYGQPHHVGLSIGTGVLHAQRYGGTVYEPRSRFLASYPSTRWFQWRG